MFLNIKYINFNVYSNYFRNYNLTLEVYFNIKWNREMFKHK